MTEVNPLTALAAYHKDHLDALAPFVRDKFVVDLGCGVFFNHAWQLLQCGARRVLGVDSKPCFDWNDPVHSHPSCQYRAVEFHNYRPPTEAWVAYVSWPSNWPTGLVELVDGSRGHNPPQVVIYRGKCTDGTLCGDDDWWHHVRQREVLAHVSRRAETLIVYGTALVERAPLSEEVAGLSDTVLMFDEDVPHSTWLPLAPL